MTSSCKLGILLATIAAVSWGASPATAQQRELLRGNMIPGQASQIRALGSPAKAGQIQPVKVIAPEAVELSVVDNGSFINTGSNKHAVGMQLGSLYRFRINGVVASERFELFPSIELLDLLHPPEGLENDFPVLIEITKSDIKEVAAGHLVTKVIYLEDQEVALPRAATNPEQPYFDVSATEDPVRTAEGLGRPMAILRIGSRVPTSQELGATSMNAFASASPTTTTPSYNPSLRVNRKYQPPIIRVERQTPSTEKNRGPITVPEATQQ